jgi:hypothetical protein
MFKEIEIQCKDLKSNDRVHFFWTEFPCGTVINGGTDILEVSATLPKFNEKNAKLVLKWNDEKIEEFKQKIKDEKFIHVKYKVDYYEPSWCIMEKDHLLTVYRNFPIEV